VSSIRELDEAIDALMKEAERKKLMILKEAEKRAEEILAREIPINDFRREADAIISNARMKREEILREARLQAEALKNIPREKKAKAVEYIVRLVVGL